LTQLEALAVVLDRPELAADPRLLCSAAQVCSSWRAAVAASGAGTTDVVLWFTVPPSLDSAKGAEDLQDHMLMLSSFAAWLSQHGSLVRSITLHGLAGNVKATVITAYQVLGMALQLAAVRAGARPMKLQVFSSDGASNVYASRPLLAALPDCLTELHVTADEGLASVPADRGGFPEIRILLDVLTKFKHLRKLCIDHGPMSKWLLHPETLTPLTNLTCLELNRAACTEVGVAGRLAADSTCITNHFFSLTDTTASASAILLQQAGWLLIAITNDVPQHGWREFVSGPLTYRFTCRHAS
jgi:hypothetical protein